MLLTPGAWLAARAGCSGWPFGMSGRNEPRLGSARLEVRQQWRAVDRQSPRDSTAEYKWSTGGVQLENGRSTRGTGGVLGEQLEYFGVR